MSTPPMIFSAESLLNDDRIVTGPLEVYWGQDRWIPPNRPEQLERIRRDYAGPLPRRKWWQRLLRYKPYSLLIRLAPPEGEDLEQWGIGLAKQLGVGWAGGIEPGDKGVWIPGEVMATTASAALGSVGKAMQRLHGVQISQAQVRVEALQAKGVGEHPGASMTESPARENPRKQAEGVGGL